MHSLLEKLFAKRKISDITQLDEEEKQTFENWNKVLSKEELTVKDIEEFCLNQIEVIEGKWRSYDIDQAKKAEWIPYHTTYKTLLLAIKSPQVGREQLEKHLLELTK